MDETTGADCWKSWFSELPLNVEKVAARQIGTVALLNINFGRCDAADHATGADCWKSCFSELPCVDRPFCIGFSCLIVQWVFILLCCFFTRESCGVPVLHSFVSLLYYLYNFTCLLAARV